MKRPTHNYYYLAYFMFVVSLIDNYKIVQLYPFSWIVVAFLSWFLGLLNEISLYLFDLQPKLPRDAMFLLFSYYGYWSITVIIDMEIMIFVPLEISFHDYTFLEAHHFTLLINVLSQYFLFLLNSKQITKCLRFIWNYNN